jgi:Uncharacterised nucleotidyltransferase
VRRDQIASDPIVGAMRSCLLGDEQGAEASLERIVGSGRVDELLERAAEHRVLGALEPHIRRVPGVDAAVLDRLTRQAIGHAAHQLRILEGLRWFGSLMETEDIRWLTFKGPVVAQLLYRPALLRTFQDLDLLVAQADFRRAIAALEREGAVLLDRNWRLIAREGRAQLHVALPLETEADIHWHVLNRQSIRSTFTLDISGAFDRSRVVEIEGVPAPTFGEVDTLVHLALHASLGGADRLSWFEDVRRAIVLESPSWDEVIERARSWGAGATVAVTLRRARAALGAEVPEWALRQLDPSALHRSIGPWVERRWPVDRPHTERGPVSLWARLIRDGAGATARTVAYRLLQPVSGAYHRMSGEPMGQNGSPSGAVFQPGGTLMEQRRYMDQVTSGDA